jgi:hypothetical protein
VGKSSRVKRDRREGYGPDVGRAHDAGELCCSNCGAEISPNEMSFSTEFGDELLVSCYRCAPGLMEVFDAMFGTGRGFREGWLHHCAGEVDAFERVGKAS